MNEFLKLTALQLKRYRSLDKASVRCKENLFLAEGDHLTGEAIKQDIAHALLLMEGREERYAGHLNSGLPVYLLKEATYYQLADTKNPQGITAVCKLPSSVKIESLGPRLLALNAVQDPGNVGTIIRSMDAAGFTGLILDAFCADPFSPKALRASMGSVFRLPICRVSDLQVSLRNLTFHKIIAGTLDGEPFFQRKNSPRGICLLIGSEGAGLSDELLQLSHTKLKLPMRGGAESLNAAVAASIMMYDFLRVWEESV